VSAEPRGDRERVPKELKLGVGRSRGTNGIDAVRAAKTLEEMLAERVAQEATRMAEERIKEMFRVTEFDPDEVFGFMSSEEAAEFLGLPYSSFREIAPNLPRHAITPARFGYLRRELLAWGLER
jgi:hypothetical protein